MYNMGGPQKIQISEIIYVAQAGEVDIDEAVVHVCALDGVWMEYYQANKDKK